MLPLTKSWSELEPQLRPLLLELAEHVGVETAGRLLRRELAKANREFFARYYFPHYFEAPTPEWHFELDKIVDEAMATAGQGRKGAVILAPRGHAKSTRLTFLRVIHEALFNDSIQFILVISDTGTQTEKMITAIKTEFELNEKLREDFGDLVGERYWPVQQWNNTNLTLCWPLESGKATRTGRPIIGRTKLIAGRSAGSSLRGLKHRAARPNLIILDDVENREAVESPTQREKLRTWFWSDVVPMLAPGGVIVVIGTVLHYDCLLEHLAKSDMFRCVRFQAIKEDGSPLWPERFPLEELENLRQSMGTLLFNQEFMNIPISGEVQVFPPENFSWYTGREVAYDEEKGWLFRGEPLTVYLGVDPAIGSKEQNDETALVTIGVTPSHDVVVLEAVAGRWPFPEQIKRILDCYYDWLPSMVGIETNAYQKALKQAIQEKEIIPVRSLVHTGDKYMRLLRISPVQEAGKIYLREALTGEPGRPCPMNRIPRRVHESCYVLYEQMIQYPKSARDDVVDALENAISISSARKFFERRGQENVP
ncbi:MAG: hypothetical protein ACPL5F_01460 [Moorellaceae bacterium]